MTRRKLPRRQVFVLTPEEKRAVACIVGAFLLGLGTMHYRATHPRPAAAPTAKEPRPAKENAGKIRASPSRARATPAAEDDE